mmetsp:Transcript_29562/g.47393  ORF Transcript_29562/g.47393 Transcript_29562/m.47393 type:complete len:88 (+) Transcript_29562:73-336(+)
MTHYHQIWHIEDSLVLSKKYKLAKTNITTLCASTTGATGMVVVLLAVVVVVVVVVAIAGLIEAVKSRPFWTKEAQISTRISTHFDPS